jgi:phospholipid/cholesterol/gamma-HCH transport system substrate-binding protein
LVQQERLALTMETKAHHILIGAFVLLAIVGGLLFSLWVAKVSLDSEFDEYNVVFKETVTGLTKGAAVNFNGIQVGEVRRLSLDRNDASRVLARIRVGSDTPIMTNTTARLTYTGLTGVAIIELVAGSVDAPPLMPPSDTELAIIMAEPSAFQKIMTDGGDVLIRFNTALERVSEVLNEENTERLTRTLAHVESIAAQIDTDKAELGIALRRADQAFADLSAASSAFRDLATQGGETLTQANRLLQEDLAPAATDLRQTLDSLRGIADQIDQLLARNGTQIDQLAQQGVPDLTAALDEFRVLAENLSRITRRLDQAPADYLLQRDRPREYKQP